MGEGREGGFTPDKPMSLGAPGSKSYGTGRPGVGLEKRCGRTPGGGGECAALSSVLGSQHMIQTEIAHSDCCLEIAALWK